MTMTFDKHNLTFDSDLQLFGTDSVANDVAHVLCEQGCFYFTFDGRPFCLKRHEAMIIGIQHLVEVIGRSDDLKVCCIYVNSQFLEVCSPRNNYGIRGSLSLFVNPIMPLSESMFHRLKLDFQQIYDRYQDEEHQFMADVMMASTQLLFLDFFDVHAQLYGQADDVTTQHALLIDRFISLLEQGSYVRHRAVKFYSDQLFVTPKYLSEICKIVSGKTAFYWINRFTTIHLRRLLKEHELSFKQISDQFGFSSLAYFSRYVQKNLGMPPSAFRE